tara:strand:+ start:329 stop:442 length:114 start_codon:yes stop_codon:yes gene_type:complete
MKNFFFGRQENYLSERQYPLGSFYADFLQLHHHEAIF